MPLPDDPLKTLENMPIPAPDAARKAATILAAREEFSAHRQETSWLRRLLGMQAGSSLPNPKEQTMRMKTLMRTTAIVAVIGAGAILYVEQHAPENIAANQPKMIKFATSLDGGPASSSPAAPAPQVTTSSNSSSPQVAPSNSLDLSGALTKSSSQVGARLSINPLDWLSSEPTPVEEKSIPFGTALGQTASRAPQADYIIQSHEEGRDKFFGRPDNPWNEVAAASVSTFSADVDTASYSVVRRMLRQGVLPTKEAVRLEELINYFDYDYSLPTDKAQPFQPTVAVYPTPWNEKTKLMHIGIKGFDIESATRPNANIVLLVDVSGSMNAPDKLPLVISSFRLLLDKLGENDTVAIVTYAGSSGVALPPTKASNKEQILAALEMLSAGGGTAGAAGIQTAYELAKQNFAKEGINRIILATDGDFNIGNSEPVSLADVVARERKSGVFLSVLGFGMGNYQDVMMQTLAQNGNGTAAYIDNLSEARRVLSDELDSTLFTIAKDVKFQVEFNPKAVTSYRLLGYETRMLAKEDFDNDKVDAGDIGAGHEVTAIYEITTVDTPALAPSDSRYTESKQVPAPQPLPDELAFLKLRYKLPDSDTSQLMTRPITKADMLASVNEASGDIRFGASVAGFAQLLRGAADMGSYSMNDVVTLANGARGADENGTRAEFVELARTAASLGGLAQPTRKEEGGAAFVPTP